MAPAASEPLNPSETLLMAVSSSFLLMIAADVEVLIKSPVTKLSNPSFTCNLLILTSSN